MRTYRAQPSYTVRVNESTSVVFNYAGLYETEDEAVIRVLDSLVPTYIQRVDTPKQPKQQLEEKPRKASIK